MLAGANRLLDSLERMLWGFWAAMGNSGRREEFCSASTQADPLLIISRTAH